MILCETETAAKCNTVSCRICFSITSCAGYGICISCILRSAQGLLYVMDTWKMVLCSRQKNMFEELGNNVLDPDSLISDQDPAF